VLFIDGVFSPKRNGDLTDMSKGMLSPVALVSVALGKILRVVMCLYSVVAAVI